MGLWWEVRLNGSPAGWNPRAPPDMWAHDDFPWCAISPIFIDNKGSCLLFWALIYLYMVAPLTAGNNVRLLATRRSLMDVIASVRIKSNQCCIITRVTLDRDYPWDLGHLHVLLWISCYSYLSITQDAALPYSCEPIANCNILLPKEKQKQF